MKKIVDRFLTITLPSQKSAFLWGPRQVGKSFWLSTNFLDVPKIDLLQRDLYAEYATQPHLLRERFIHHQGLVIIDEVQLIPDLLPEIHWLIENSACSFFLTGSSARKLRRIKAHTLGGRARRYHLCPLTFGEIGHYSLEQIMVSGLLPAHFLSDDPLADLRAYIGDYLKEEIASEAEVRSIPSFSQFLHTAAVLTGELLNYTNVAREAGVSAKTVRNYFEILEDTFLGFRLSPWQRSKGRRLIETEKFYLFDVGVSNFLARRQPRLGTPEFGKSLEHLILLELIAYREYRSPDLLLSFWRTSSGLEVDFILNDCEILIEVKGSSRVHETDTKNLALLLEEQKAKKAYLVCLERQTRTLSNNIEILPLEVFIQRLWAGEIL